MKLDRPADAIRHLERSVELDRSSPIAQQALEMARQMFLDEEREETDGS